jgi:hypothetical protein
MLAVKAESKTATLSVNHVADVEAVDHRWGVDGQWKP